MKFCPRCGSILMPRIVEERKILACSCGHSEEADDVALKEPGRVQKKVEIVEGNDSVNVVVDAECTKCGHRRAEYWEVQTRSADEPPTRFHKCTKCGHTWREYS